MSNKIINTDLKQYLTYLKWVKERVIPSGRQNIGTILKNHRLIKYSEMALLALSRGRSAQDACYLKIVEEEEIPENIKQRRKKNVQECFVTRDNQLLCMFTDNMVRKVDLTKMTERYKEVAYVLKNEEILRSVSIGVGGDTVSFGGVIEISASELRESGELLPLTTGDFYDFISTNIIDTTVACDKMKCSRQNLSYMVNEGKIKPVIRGTKENLYLKSEIERRKQE